MAGAWRSSLARREDPVIKIEDYGRIIAVALPQRKVGAGTILRRDRADAQGADVAAVRQGCARKDFAPGEDRVAGEGRRDVSSGVDTRDMEGVGEAVEAQRARQRDDMAAIDQTTAEAALAFSKLIEMDLGGVLEEARRNLMLGFLDRHAVDVVDPF